MFKIFITRQIPNQGIKMLKAKGYAVSIYPKDQVIPRKDLLRGVKGAHGIICDLTEKIDGELLNAAGKQLKIVANYAVGVDNLDLAACKKHGVYATNTPGVLTESVAEHAFMLMLAVARRTAESDTFIRQGQYHGWGPMLLLGTELKDKTLGIVGLGRIGLRVAEMAVQGMRMRVLYNSKERNLEFEKNFSAKGGSASGGEKKFGAKYRKNLNDLLKEADFVTLHVPLLPSTRHLINAKNLKLMKKTAYLVNTSRGPVVDEKALVAALKKKTIAGAGLDVFEFEPKLTPGLTNLQNVVLTPHTASATWEARQAMSRIAAENIIAAFSGKTPPNLVK